MRPHPSEVFRDLKNYPFFASFDDTLLMQISTVMSTVSFKMGDQILTQGQTNDCLYFLKSGQIDVIVDNEKVASLSIAGEVLGEMSVFSAKPVSATIVSKTDTHFYVLNPNEFDHILPKDKEKFLYLMYKIYSIVVADRLMATNEKAKKFEIANRDLERAQKDLEHINKNLEDLVNERTKELRQKAAELESSRSELEQQNAALVAGFRKVTDLAESRDKAFDKIRVLSNEHLEPLQKSLTQFQSLSDAKGKELLGNVMGGLDDVISFMKPLTDLAQAEKAIQSKRVLIVDPEKKQQLVARMALGGTGVQLDLASESLEAQALLAQKKYDLILCEAEQSSVIEWARAHKFAGEIVLMTSNEIQSYLEKLKSLSFVGHVVSRDTDDRTFTIKSIHTTVSKILNDDFFGLEKYLAWGVEMREIRILESAKRGDAIQDMKQHLSNIGVRTTILERCHSVAEEMLMNAIYDAPADANGKALFNHLDRTVEVHLQSDQATTLRYACDGNLLGISVSDPFGGLTKEIIIRYLDSCYQGNAGIFNGEKGGAGRGLHQMIEGSDLVIFNVKKGIKTEVICLFNIDSTAKKDIQKPTFHYFFS